MITNKYGLPTPLANAVKSDIRPRDGFSITDLIQPPRITQLMRRHWAELETDASERIWILLGRSIHRILAQDETPGFQREQEIIIDVDGIPVMGHPDLCTDIVIYDYKITSVWSVIFEPHGRKDWHAQLNLYRWMRLQHGLQTEALKICAILRDWQRTKTQEPDYPPLPVAIINIPVWPIYQAETYLKKRLKMHLEAQSLPDGELPLCTEADMWAKPTTYAIMKKGRNTAVKVCSTRQEAEEKMFKGEYIVERPGQRSRCQRYCEVNRFCSQYKEAYENKINHPLSKQGWTEPLADTP